MIFDKRFTVIRVLALAIFFIAVEAAILLHNQPSFLRSLRNQPIENLEAAYGWKIARVFRRYKKLKEFDESGKAYIAVFGGSTTDQNLRNLEDDQILEIAGIPLLNMSLQNQTWPEMVRLIDGISSPHAKVVFSYYPWSLFKNPISPFKTHQVSYGKERPHPFESPSLAPFYGNSIPERKQSFKDRFFPWISPYTTYTSLELGQWTKSRLAPLKESLGLVASKKETETKKKKKARKVEAQVATMWSQVKKDYKENITRNLKVLEQISDICRNRNIPFAIVRLPFNKITYDKMKHGIDFADEGLSRLIEKKAIPELSLKPHPFFEDPKYFSDHGHYSSTGHKVYKKKIIKSYSRVFESQ